MNTAVPAPVTSLIRGTNESAPLTMPQVGLGTYKVDVDQAERVVADALAVGYRHIDTAQMYGNEAGVGAAIAASGIPRDRLWVTSKLDNPNHRRDDALRSFDATMRDLRLDVLDLFLVHWPLADSPGIDLVDTWRTMIEILESGRVRAIGVSNFLEGDLQNILNHCEVKPAVDQLLAHIGNTPFELAAFCENNDILVEAYSPIAHGEADKIGAIVKMAERYDVSVAQLCIRYVLQLGMVALPKTANLEHMRSNADVDFEISAQDMETLRGVERISDYGDSSFFPVFGGKL